MITDRKRGLTFAFNCRLYSNDRCRNEEEQREERTSRAINKHAEHRRTCGEQTRLHEKERAKESGGSRGQCIIPLARRDIYTGGSRGSPGNSRIRRGRAASGGGGGGCLSVRCALLSRLRAPRRCTGRVDARRQHGNSGAAGINLCGATFSERAPWILSPGVGASGRRGRAGSGWCGVGVEGEWYRGGG